MIGEVMMKPVTKSRRGSYPRKAIDRFVNGLRLEYNGIATKPNWTHMYSIHERGTTRVPSADFMNHVLIVKYDRRLGMNVEWCAHQFENVKSPLYENLLKAMI